MKRKGLLTLLGGICVLLVSVTLLLMPSCAKPAPARVPKVHERFDIQFSCGSTTGSTYLISFPIAEIISRYSPWLRASAVEVGGSTLRIGIILDKPELKKTMFFPIPDVEIVAATKGLPPFKQAWTGARAVIPYVESSHLFVTYRDTIKSRHDFVGKRIMYYTKTTAPGIMFDCMFKDVWKIWKDVSISYGMFDASSRALRDGVIDIAHQSINGLGDYRTPNSELLQLSQEKPGFHLVGISPEDTATLAKVSGYPWHSVTYPAGALKEIGQREEVSAPANTLCLYTDESMDEDVVYELVRIVYENIDKIKARYALFPVTKDNIGMLPVPEDLIHPGALKFFKEKGVSIGMR